MRGVNVVAEVVCGGIPFFVGLDLCDWGFRQDWRSALRGDEEVVLVGDEADAVAA